MEENEVMDDYYVRVKIIVNKMVNLVEQLENTLMIKKVLRKLTPKQDSIALIFEQVKLTPKWDSIAFIIEEAKNLSTIQFDGFIGSLVLHEKRLRKL